jgi:hypothetical protein
MYCVVGVYCLLIKPSALCMFVHVVFKVAMERCAEEEGAMAQMKLI